MSETPVLTDLTSGADTDQRPCAPPRPGLPLVVLVAVGAGLLAGACGGGETDGTVSARIDGMSWQAPGEAFIIANSGGATSFDLLAATHLPSSPSIDSSKPQLLIVFPQGLPSVGSYSIDGVTVNVQYQVDLRTLYAGTNGSVQITSIGTSRAQGAFNFELQSPINDPMALTVTEGAFDVPVSTEGPNILR